MRGAEPDLLTHEPKELEEWESFADFVRMATGHDPVLGEQIVLAIDAPFGFPAAFSTLVGRGPRTAKSKAGQLDNAYAFRQTDRHIADRFKTPLSAAFDKLGNNASVAMHFLDAWREEGLRVSPFDLPRLQSRVAIEVYPAIIRESANGSIPTWITALDPGLIGRRNLDLRDAIICAALALAWAEDGMNGRPMLARPEDSLPPNEGWIYYPIGTEWKPRREDPAGRSRIR